MQWMNGGVCSIEIATPDVGFFAQMTWCLCILQYCKLRGLVPDIRLTGKTFVDNTRGSNWLHYYFDPLIPDVSVEIRASVRYTKKIVRWGELGPLRLPNMSVAEGSQILYEYLHLKRHITALVDDVWGNAGFGGPIVGVHYRGTDKSSEAPRVSWEHCLGVLNDHLDKHPEIGGVFAASDEQGFIDFVKKSARGVSVHTNDDHFRSKDQQPIHTSISNIGGYEKGEDALVNALLLSKCTTLIRTTSFLSAWASIFNPAVRVILLNKPYTNSFWYPESEIFRLPDTEYRPERGR
jgi:hypothetical protein